MGHAAKAKLKATVMQSTRKGWERLRLTRRQTEVLVVVAVILVMGAVALVRVQEQNPSGSPKELTLTQVLSQANNYQAQKKYTAAEDLLNDYIKKHPNDNKGISQAQSMLGSVYQAEGKGTQALDAYKKSVSSGTASYGDYMSLGDAAAAAGDKQAAINYYKQAITAVKAANPPGTSAYVAHFQAEITSLGGKP